MTFNLADFPFTFGSDLVLQSQTIINNTSVATLSGDDTISADVTKRDGSDTVYGIFNDLNASIVTGEGNDTISGSAEVRSSSYSVDTAIGINNSGEIETGSGNDSIIGKATVADENTFGSSSNGISNDLNGSILTGSGDDTISGNAYTTLVFPEQSSSNGISNQGSVDTGAGNDVITGNATVTGVTDIPDRITAYGIYGSGTINTGIGNDQVIVTSTINDNQQKINLGGGITIDLGDGNDYLAGFGTATVNGGYGKDILDLGLLAFGDVAISGANLSDPNRAANFTYEGITTITSGFEQFIFNGVTYNYAQLV
jgi:hypothetical protein